MITEEEKEQLNIHFTDRKRLMDNISWNEKEVKDLRLFSLTDLSEEDYAKVNRSIKRGSGLISTQKTELMKLSIQKIADKTGLQRHVVSTKYNLFDHCGHRL